MEKKTVKKKVEKKAVKPVKLSLKDKLIETVVFIENSVKEERGKSLNTTSCAKLNKAAFTINTIIKTL
jgi:hypothetical protein|tara:strand:+ start:1715 stop:1918 length:204 start_codon:yes stop_codon:yes gene_type:complete